jgi:MoxR-like ATPase
MDGTYPLPEAQVDRFFMRAAMGYPDSKAEAAILKNQRRGSAADHVDTVLTADHVERMIDVSSRVRIADAIDAYIVDVVSATRDLPEIRLGASPRGSLNLSRAARTWAVAQGRAFVTPEDVKDVAGPVLAHRLLLTPQADLQGVTGTEIIERVLDSRPVPQAVQKS